MDVHDGLRQRIIEAAAALLDEGGREALTTRSVASAAGTQAPNIYRLFGDKDGLLDAVAEHGFTRYLADKLARTPKSDPVEDMRHGWDLHVAFGLSNPALFSLMYGEPRPGNASPAVLSARAGLLTHIRAIAAAGRLKVSEERAAEMIQVGGCGTVFVLLSMPEHERDCSLSVAAREAVLAAITTDVHVLADHRAPVAASALRSELAEVDVLSDAERRLLDEWLRRIASD
ncbi:TetR/AcrR family transcriptional regulator [Ciceribacter sp. L1K23]|uniref:TetR/AcrR family transcriptional regulator n=1 Tax=unclassified Ciceribacter TaxID=2628820 RepID=UPI001ABE7E93|nr:MULTISPECIES: TetR/AcrR family transcriptional regulator [unclassified Ciceribacter]MBO3761074.1 TetR/AcrR family transcriptional regulator [Ciceribacter sp. L1K22]MBR0554850.1 TetR/AcrR family transcriptional regulator [Ciceribacter sp. L1K23]